MKFSEIVLNFARLWPSFFSGGGEAPKFWNLHYTTEHSSDHVAVSQRSAEAARRSHVEKQEINKHQQ